MKTFTNILIPMLVILFISSSTFAQSQYLNKDEKAFEIGFGVQKNARGAQDIGLLNLGFGSKGTFDIALQLGNSSGTHLYGVDINAYFIKENGKFNFPFSIGFLFKGEFVNGDYSAATAFTAGGFLRKDIKLSKKSGIQPFISSFYSIQNNANSPGGGGGLSLYFGEKTIGALNIGYYVTEFNNALVVSLSFIGKGSIKKESDYYFD